MAATSSALSIYGWQVTLCDPIQQVMALMPHGSEMVRSGELYHLTEFCTVFQILKYH